MDDCDRIVEAVAWRFGFSRSELLAGSRSLKPVAEARQLAMFLTRRLVPGMTLTSIGEYFGRDRTTVSHAVQKVSAKRTPEIKKLEKEIASSIATFHAGKFLDTTVNVGPSDEVGDGPGRD